MMQSVNLGYQNIVTKDERNFVNDVFKKCTKRRKKPRSKKF